MNKVGRVGRGKGSHSTAVLFTNDYYTDMMKSFERINRDGVRVKDSISDWIKDERECRHFKLSLLLDGQGRRCFDLFEKANMFCLCCKSKDGLMGIYYQFNSNK